MESIKETIQEEKERIIEEWIGIRDRSDINDVCIEMRKKALKRISDEMDFLFKESPLGCCDERCKYQMLFHLHTRVESHILIYYKSSMNDCGMWEIIKKEEGE